MVARDLAPGPGHAWIGAGVALTDRPLVVVWAVGQHALWVVLTDPPPERLGSAWYGLWIWVELGFRAHKSLGWQWQRTRRRAPARVSVFVRGWTWLPRQVVRGRVWRRPWLAPPPWPWLAAGLRLTLVAPS